ncbi:hypothetical protein BJ085DRAFT_35212 [Dimargaris cristalligena]|uniref:SEC7 domain-containing protein n=1 Tax=Dimargaris cristalligena TaxID=215637 RepID=A0A4P9ZTU2_9FUNG|nr:hypothetical protein BJ085DRAFT_35212 [Dimargaris cristalligena]|eukprot:RKP35980.1 hypothetical protein BJ085DRAFT_35212 [Dimargaris cristalligena]
MVASADTLLCPMSFPPAPFVPPTAPTTVVTATDILPTPPAGSSPSSTGSAGSLYQSHSAPVGVATLSSSDGGDAHPSPVAIAEAHRPTAPTVSSAPSRSTLSSQPSLRRLATSPAPISGSSLTVDKLKEQQRMSRQRSIRRSRDADFYTQIENTINYKDRDPKKVLDHLKRTHPKSELGTLLARKDGFHETLLQTYMASLDFGNQPIDIALRKLLGELHLPKETQQIDRIIHGFAKRYHESNPNLFDSADSVYTLAFSLMLLHTDAHNIHVKQKMTKEQYMKMARSMDNNFVMPSEVLDILYDNITYVQFFYADQIDMDKDAVAASGGGSAAPGPSQSTPLGAEGPIDIIRPSTSSSTNSSTSTLSHLTRKLHLYQAASAANSQPTASAAATDSPTPRSFPLTRSQSQGGGQSGFSWVKNKLLGRSQSVPLTSKPVALMQQVTNAMLSPKLGPYTPSQSPYTYHGSQSILRDAIMRGVFKINVPLMRPYRQAVSGRAQPNLTIANHAANEKPSPSVTVLRCAKEGFLIRKVDVLENGKRAPVRSWKDFWVVLSGSQLVLFRNIDWFRNPKNRMPAPGQDGSDAQSPSTSPPGDAAASASFHLNPFSFGRDPSVKYSSPPPKPHTVIPTVNGVCVLDSDYTKYPYVFRFVAGDGRQYLFRASSDDDVDDWMAKINYAAAFKTLEVATRGVATPTITVDSDQWSHLNDTLDRSTTASFNSNSFGSKINPTAAPLRSKPRRPTYSEDGFSQTAPPPRPGSAASSIRSQRKGSHVSYHHLSFSPPASPHLNRDSAEGSPDTAPHPNPADPTLSRNYTATAKLNDVSPPASPRVVRSTTACSASIPTTTAISPPHGNSSVNGGGTNPCPTGSPERIAIPPRSPSSLGANSSALRTSYETIRERIAFFSRRDILKKKIVELEERIEELKAKLQKDLRLHQQLAIMVPFQRTTRQRATIVIDNLRQQIKKQYLNLQKFECYREILETDLQIEIELERGDYE